MGFKINTWGTHGLDFVQKNKIDGLEFVLRKNPHVVLTNCQINKSVKTQVSWISLAVSQKNESLYGLGIVESKSIALRS